MCWTLSEIKDEVMIQNIINVKLCSKKLTIKVSSIARLRKHKS